MKYLFTLLLSTFMVQSSMSANANDVINIKNVKLSSINGECGVSLCKIFSASFEILDRKVESKDEYGKFYCRVSSVNGQILNKPIVIELKSAFNSKVNLSELPKGRLLNFHVYESMRVADEPTGGAPVQGRGPHIQNYLCVLKPLATT